MKFLSNRGQGTYYQLLKSLNPALNEEHMLKVVSVNSAENMDNEIMIYRSIEKLKKVNSALEGSVIQYYGCFEEKLNNELMRVMVLEKLGEDLHSLMQRIRAADLEIRFFLYLRFALLVKALHDVSITHCSLSTKNILAFDENLDDFRLINFGFARINNSFCKGGTPGFYIPSQHDVDLKSKDFGKQDIFSLAVIMLILESPPGTYQTFVDRISNKKYDFTDIYEQIAKKNLPSFEPSNSFFGLCSTSKKSTKELLYVEFNNLFKGMLRKAPSDRPTISEVITALESMLVKIKKIALKGGLNII